MSRFMNAAGGVGEGMGIRLMKAMKTTEYDDAVEGVARLVCTQVKAGGGVAYLRSVGGWTKLIERQVEQWFGEVDPQTNAIGVPTNAQWWVKHAVTANLGPIRERAMLLVCNGVA